MHRVAHAPRMPSVSSSMSASSKKKKNGRTDIFVIDLKPGGHLLQFDVKRKDNPGHLTETILALAEISGQSEADNMEDKKVFCSCSFQKTFVCLHSCPFLLNFQCVQANGHMLRMSDNNFFLNFCVLLCSWSMFCDNTIIKGFCSLPFHLFSSLKSFSFFSSLSSLAHLLSSVFSRLSFFFFIFIFVFFFFSLFHRRGIL